MGHDSGAAFLEGAGRTAGAARVAAADAGDEFALRQLPWLARVPRQRGSGGSAYAISKRAMDLCFVLASLPVTLALGAACVVALRLESPRDRVLFRQERTGRGGRRFHMQKFRTMIPNAEELKASLAHLNELSWPDFKMTDDPRVTRVGRLLRQSSLDELPQLLNVLRGEMSLVGPRPTSFAPETYAEWHRQRLDVVPGLTGLWQISGRGSTDFDERVRIDLAYIRRRCLLLDLQILFRTVGAVLGRRGAY